MRPDRHAPVLVTGCASGIGREIALAFLERGRPVYAVDMDEAGLAELTRLAAESAETGAAAAGSGESAESGDSGDSGDPGDPVAPYAPVAGLRTIGADIRDEAARVAMVTEIEARHGALGALVNNAGFGIYGPVETLDLGDLREAMETNVMAGIGLAQLVLPAMRAAGRGRIVLVGSVVGQASLPVLGGYATTKHAATALYDAMRMEVARFGVDVVQIEPGPVRTAFPEHTIGMFDPEVGRPPGPYRGLTTAQRRLLVAWLRAPLVTTRPETVASYVVRAVESAHPRSRYRPSLSASASVLARRLSPDRVWDWTFRLLTRM